MGKCSQSMCRREVSSPIVHLQRFDFVLLNEGYHGCRAELANGLQIEAQVAVPSTSQARRLFFPWAEGNADVAEARLSLHRCNLQWMRMACAHGASFAGCLAESQ
ncbi:hypothetical protein [Parafrankia sp. BMG5.11]|uniref:hypothetical protein n=1 Tax=Parafrankia sp. BMG5.11 TaxID=222540 RepID=UPI001A9ED0A8|nr:hypothetical protein [Parafrankia sp. BMG5.11]